MKNKIFKALAPLFVALALVGILLLAPINISPKYSKKEMNEFAQNPKIRTSFVGYSVKNQAFQDNEFLPFMGSSEFYHYSLFHPSSFFKKYDSGFTPYLIGADGTQSLTHFFYMNSVDYDLKNRKMVFVISPQWFNSWGLKPDFLANWVSKGELYSWVINAQPDSLKDQTVAKRLLDYKDFPDDKLLDNAFKAIAKGDKVSYLDRISIRYLAQLWKREDQLFTPLAASQNGLNNASQTIDKLSKQLPDNQFYDTLSDFAYADAEKNQNNNPFGILNTVWDKKYKTGMKKFHKDYQKDISYMNSPEYTDFQLLLNEFAEKKIDVQFVIQPINNKWYDYSGLSRSMVQDYVAKITEQLNSQGFNNVLDFSQNTTESFLTEDTIHFGSRGWLALDLQVQKFMKQPYRAEYKLNNEKYLSKEWSGVDNIPKPPAPRK